MVKKTILGTIVAFDAWVAISYVEIVTKNLEGIPLSTWNFFQMIL